MSPLLHAFNIATLATWLSVGAFGTVAIVVPVTLDLLQEKEDSADPYQDLESTFLTEDFSTGDLAPSQETDTGSSGEANEEEVPFAEQETLPTPPEMPETAELTPLPEVPDIAPPAPVPTKTAPAPTKPRPTTTRSSRETRSTMATNATGASIKGKPAAKGTAGNGGSNGGSGMSDAKRMAGGRMPPPSYPSAARSGGQQGTVIVEFVVGENGRVVSAYTKKSSPWPLLNDSAVRCVRNWRFPPGKVTKYVRPIVFKLN
ncbi:MAG: energy transducer TonB [Verrucomicrobiota bacterium]